MYALGMSDPWQCFRLRTRRDWAEGLATFHLDGETPEFRAGQFLRLGVDLGEREPLSRPYSVASAPGEPLEFFIVRVDGGALTPRLFDLPLGAELKVHPRAGGVFTLGMVPDAETLWFISTGTGLAPFVSMLRQGEPFERFERVVVVQCVRQPEQLCYVEELNALGGGQAGQGSPGEPRHPRRGGRRAVLPHHPGLHRWQPGGGPPRPCSPPRRPR
jgi:ferredoxin--NADP+ reductase